MDLYVARDENNSLWLYNNKPIKHNFGWFENNEINSTVMMIDETLFPNVKWEDDEPTLVTLIKYEK